MTCKNTYIFLLFSASFHRLGPSMQSYFIRAFSFVGLVCHLLCVCVCFFYSFCLRIIFLFMTKNNTYFYFVGLISRPPEWEPMEMNHDDFNANFHLSNQLELELEFELEMSFELWLKCWWHHHLSSINFTHSSLFTLVCSPSKEKKMRARSRCLPVSVFLFLFIAPSPISTRTMRTTNSPSQTHAKHSNRECVHIV